MHSLLRWFATTDARNPDTSFIKKPFTCKFCGFQFKKLTAAKSHVEINHLVMILCYKANDCDIGIPR